MAPLRPFHEIAKRLEPAEVEMLRGLQAIAGEGFHVVAPSDVARGLEDRRLFQRHPTRERVYRVTYAGRAVLEALDRLEAEKGGAP